ncbi:MAG: zinc ABC transporter substrate-binding protein, partial [Patescibacteria group bacterium]
APEWIKNGATVININEAVGGTSDPHRWLDPIFAQQYVEIIQEKLIAADPDHAQIFIKHSEILLTDLRNLNADFEQGLTNCSLQEIIVSHDAFRYLGSRYRFSTIPISGISHEEEPSPRKIAELATAAKEKGIATIFVEPLEAPDSAETLAKEIGGSTLDLNPIEGLTPKELSDGKDYIQLMKTNLAHLRVGMKCQ